MHTILFDLIFYRNKFKPTAILSQFDHLLHVCQYKKINYIVMDKDDTICKHQTYKVELRIQKIINRIKNNDIPMFIVSNSMTVDKNRNDEIKMIAGIPIINTRLKKPFNGHQISQYIERSIERQINKQQVAIIGDRLITDIYLGNKMGWTTFLIDPLEPTTVAKHGIMIYLLRKFEGIMLTTMNLEYL